MKLKYWSYFAKRTNSTKQPEDAEARVIDINPYGEFTELNPVVMTTAKITPQYAYIPDFNRYYWVSNIRYIDGMQILELAVDVLATYRTSINNLRTYITRSSVKSDKDILDILQMTKPAGHVLESRLDNPFDTGTKGDDYYILQYTGKEGINTVLMTELNMKKLCQDLWLEWGKINGMSELFASVCDPFQYILNIQRTPAGLLFWEHSQVVTIVLGNVTTTAQGFVLGKDQSTTELSIGVPKPPQSQYWPYLKSSQFCSYSLRLPGIGWVPLPADMLYNHSTLTIKFTAEPITGDMMAEVFLPNTGAIAQARGKITQPWGISSAKTEGKPGLSAVGNAGAAVIAGIKELLSGDLKDATMGALTAGAAFADTNVTTMGGLGGTVGLRDKIILQVKYQDLVLANTSELGEPFMQYDDIKNHKFGYLRCATPNFQKGYTKTEQDMVNNYLTGGFYNE